MSKLYTGIDIGSDTVKVVVLSVSDNKFHVLASSSVPSIGIKKGQVVDTKKAMDSVKLAIHQVEEKLGLKIRSVIVCVPTQGCIFNIVSGGIEVKDFTCVTGEDITNLLKDALVGHINPAYELITAMPISFKLDEKANIRDPKGMSGEFLETKVVITTVPKEPLYKILGVLDLCGIETVDLAFGTTGDYFEVRNKELDTQVGAIINIGEDSTNISIYNKGIMIKNSVIAAGSRHVDHDISYIYKIDKRTARHLKENFSVSVSKVADQFDIADIVQTDGKKLTISQLDITKVVEARLEEILKLSKKEIKNLTNREISYIIITGGLSELAGFQYIAEEVLGRRAIVWNMTTMGIRHNKYTSVLGLLKYFDSKMMLRGKEFSMFNSDETSSLISTKKQEDINENIINRVFEHFLDK